MIPALSLVLPLAQSEPTQSLQLPISYGGISAIVIGGVILLALVGFWLLRELQAGRAAIVEEVRTQLEAGPKAQPVEVQSPLTVTPHVLYVPREEFDKEIRNAHGRMNRERAEADAKVAELGRKLDAAQQAGADREIRINSRIDDLRTEVGALPAATVRLLRETKGLL